MRMSRNMSQDVTCTCDLLHFLHFAFGMICVIIPYEGLIVSMMYSNPIHFINSYPPQMGATMNRAIRPGLNDGSLTGF